ncbi:MAG: hypothetical protein KAG53_04455 [Endozoicomonadaceae bacterium]|nr:hypothetical protein [Endozoicomonadaceae bacterium]
MNNTIANQNQPFFSSLSQTIIHNDTASENSASEKSFLGYFVTSVLHICKKIKGCTSSLVKSIYSRKVCFKKLSDKDNIILSKKILEKTEIDAENASDRVKSINNLLHVYKKQLGELLEKNNSNLKLASLASKDPVFFCDESYEGESEGIKEINVDIARCEAHIDHFINELIATEIIKKEADKAFKNAVSSCRDLKLFHEGELERLNTLYQLETSRKDKESKENDGFFYVTSILAEKIAEHVEHAISLQKLLNETESYFNNKNHVELLKKSLKDKMSAVVTADNEVTRIIEERNSNGTKIHELSELLKPLITKIKDMQSKCGDDNHIEQLHEKTKKLNLEIVSCKRNISNLGKSLSAAVALAKQALDRLDDDAFDHRTSIFFIQEKLRKLSLLYSFHSEKLKKDGVTTDNSSGLKEIKAEFNKNVCFLHNMLFHVKTLTQNVNEKLDNVTPVRDVPENFFDIMPKDKRAQIA